MNLLLFEPALMSFAGHYSRYVRVIAAEAARCGVRLSVACSNRIDPAMQEALEMLGVEIIPAFPPLPYRMQSEPAQRAKVSRILAGAALTCFSGRRQAKVAWLSGTASLLGGVCMFAREAKVKFAMQMLDFARDWPEGKLTAPPDLRGLAESAFASGMKVYLQSPLLARRFEDEVGVPAMPFPAILDLKPLRQRKSSERPVVGVMNMMRSSKQPWTAMEALVAHGDSLSIVLHMGQGVTRADLDRARLDIMRFLSMYGVKAPRIQVSTGILAVDAYNGLWQLLDSTVMPYDPARYRRQGSGIMFESLSDGIVPIAPEGTSMADVMRQEDVGISYDSSDPLGLHGAIGRLVSDFPSLAARSYARAGAYREANSPSKVLSILMES